MTIPNSVTNVGDLAFSGCIALNSVGWSVKNCQNFTSSYAPFKGATNIKTFYFGNTVNRIPAYLCYELANLKTVTIGTGVTVVGKEAFTNCNALTRVNISDLAKWCSIDFPSPQSNPTTYAKCLYLNNKQITALTIPGGTSKVKQYAFYNCECLTSVTIPNSVTAIDREAFYGCSGVTTVSIDNSVMSFASGAFEGCNAVDKVNIGDLNAWLKSDFANAGANPLNNGALMFLNGNELSNVVIPDDITAVPAYSFFKSLSLKSLSVPSHVESIGTSAFTGCENLSILSVDNNKFADSNNFPNGIKYLTIGNSVTDIRQSAFSSCNQLVRLSIGESVKSIGANAFSGSCMSAVYSYNPTPPEIVASTFSTCSYQNATLYTPKEASTLYWLHPYWENFVNIKEMTDDEDINEDNAINVGDVNAVLEAIIEENDDPKFDVNKDNNVNVGDVNVILEKILIQRAKRRAHTAP